MIYSVFFVLALKNELIDALKNEITAEKQLEKEIFAVNKLQESQVSKLQLTVLTYSWQSFMAKKSDLQSLNLTYSYVTVLIYEWY